MRLYRWLALLVGGLLLAGVTPALPAAAAVAAMPSYPVPSGCTPVPIALALSGSSVCVHDLLVTDTLNTGEQNRSLFTASDGQSALHATVPNWWPSGGPVAGMVVTLWGKQQAGLFKVDRWLEFNHGSGPAPEGPYPRVSLLDVAEGKVPALKMVWVPTIVFALDPQDTGDGDIHVQTTLPCPAAGLTGETTPPLRGYVDHPAGVTVPSATDPTGQDKPSQHLGDAPPIGVPIMMLGQTRVDFGFGWWEIHPIRAWRLLTSAETQQLAMDCQGTPVPPTDPNSPTGEFPFGVPPCTDGSEFNKPPGYQPCQPHCFVTRTEIGKPDVLAGPCAGIAGAGQPASAGGGGGPGATVASQAGATQLPPTGTGPPALAALASLTMMLGGMRAIWHRRRLPRRSRPDEGEA